MSVERRPVRNQILLLRAVAAPGEHDAAAIAARARRRRLHIVDLHSALQRLVARGYLIQRGAEYLLTAKAKKLPGC